MHCLAALGIDDLRDGRIGKCILCLPGIIDGKRQDDQKDPDKAELRLRQEFSPWTDARNQVPVRRLLQRLREQHDQSGHQQKHRNQAADDSLCQDNTHVITQPELHHGQSDQS